MIPYLLETIGSLSVKFRKSIIPYIYRIVPLIIDCIQDQSETEKRIKALNALTKVITGSGFVILPYYIYPNLFTIIKNLMKFEQNQQIRKEALRLMGAIGAIDPHLFKKV